MQQSLRANRSMDARLEAIDLTLHLENGESIHTEWSCKFTRDQVAEELADAGLDVINWWMDTEKRFALALARKASIPAT